MSINMIFKITKYKKEKELTLDDCNKFKFDIIVYLQMGDLV